MIERKKSAFVSGASQGIGEAIAIVLAANSYKVYVNGRDEKKVTKVVNFIRQNGGEAEAVVADFCNSIQIHDTLNHIVKNNTKLDVVVANIGSGKSINGYDIPLDEYKRVFDINFFSAVSLVNESLLHMDSGNIVIISSIAGCESIGAPVAYACAKSAILSFVKNLSDNLAKRNIRINAVSPGNVFFEGGSWDTKIKNGLPVQEYIEKTVPLKRFATPHEIAEAVLFLINASFITGHNLIVDGGQVRKFL